MIKKIPPTLFARLEHELDPLETQLQADCKELFSHRAHSPYLIIIPAFNEAESIGYVADLLPSTILGVRPDVLVVDDGSTDGTAAIAQKHGLNCITSSVNRGQGASLRTGYLAAIANDFVVVAIIDADGQWSPSDLEQVMMPVINHTADLSQGSRSLGETRVGDRFRDIGVAFFARLISIITRRKVTDTSSGIRAISVNQLKSIRLTQPQYQSSELLIGALIQGGRLSEIPVIMESRHAGYSKKGRNLKYALAYSQVVFKTTLREFGVLLLNKLIS